MSNFSLFFFLNRFKILTFFDRSLTGRLFLYFFSNFIIFLTFSRATTRFTIFHLTIFLLNKVESNNKVNCDVLKKKKKKRKDLGSLQTDSHVPEGCNDNFSFFPLSHK